MSHARTWWVDRMIRSDRPLEEKMTLFWHNLFTSGFREVRTGRLMSKQVELLHSEALGNYRKLVYLAQSPQPGADAEARAIAERMGLAYEYRHTGYGALETALRRAVDRPGAGSGERGDLTAAKEIA